MEEHIRTFEIWKRTWVYSGIQNRVKGMEMQGNMKFSFLFAMIQETIVLLETKNITFDMETTIEFMIYIFIDVFFLG